MLNHKWTLIYILGSQRSGTTALEYWLSTDDRVHSLGEVKLLEKYLVSDHRDYKDNGLCTCGTILPECEFWKPVLAKTEEAMPVKVSGIKTNISGKLYKEFVVDKAAQTVLFSIYENASKKSDKNILTDSSKDINYLSALTKIIPIENIFVIHLVRNPVSVITSKRKWIKKRNLKTISSSSMFLHWLYRECKSVYILKRLKLKHISIKFEDFNNDPHSIVREVSEGIGVNLKLSRKISLRSLHTIAGTPSRFKADIFQIGKHDEGNADEHRDWLPIIVYKIGSAIENFVINLGKRRK